MRNDDDRKWLYDTMQSKGVDTGNYDEFCKSLNNKEDRDWYYQKSLEFGLNVGTDKDFTDMMADNTNSPSNGFDNPLKKLRQFAERVGVPNGQSVPTSQAVPTGLPESAQQNDVAQSVSTGQESQEEQQLSEVEALGRNRSGKQVVSIPETSYDMGEGYMHPRSHEDFLRHRIIAAEKPGDSPEDGTFESLSASANMLFPLIGKMSFGSYLLNHNGIQNYVCNELSMEDIQAEKKMSELDQRSRIIVLMKRWLIYKPQVFILRALIIESFLKKMAAEGSAIILLVSQPEYIEDIADKMIRVDSEL